MKQESLITKIDLDSEDRQQIANVIEKIEDTSPSDASVFFKLEKKGDKYVGSLKVISRCVDINVAQEDFEIQNLLDILNDECKVEIDKWKKNRNI